MQRGRECMSASRSRWYALSLALLMAWMAAWAPWQMGAATTLVAATASGMPCHGTDNTQAKPPCPMDCCDTAQCGPDCPFMLACVLPLPLVFAPSELTPVFVTTAERGISRPLFPDLRPPIA